LENSGTFASRQAGEGCRPTWVLEEGTIEARHTLPYADAFAVAVADRANLVSGDRQILDAGGPTWPTIGLRS
jgi:predicted nucleic acid-binding protein